MLSTESRSSTLTRVLVIALLVLPAVVTLTAAPVTAQTNGADVYIKDLLFDDELVVGKSVQVTAVLGNKGDRTYGGQGVPFRVCFTWNVSMHNTNGQGSCANERMSSPYSLNQRQTTEQERNYQSSVTVSGGIPPNGEVRATIEWTPDETRPNGHPQGGDGIVWVTFSRLEGPVGGLSDGDSANNHQPFPVSVQRIDVALRPLWQDFVDLADIRDACPTYASGLPAVGNCRVRPGDTLRLELEVQNRGNREDRFTFYQYGASGGNDSLGCDGTQCMWNVSFSTPSVTVPAYGKRVVNVTLEVPRTGTHAQAGHTINGYASSASAPVRIAAVSLTDAAKDANTYIPRLIVDQIHRVNMTTWEEVRVGNVSKVLRFNFSVGNPGNGRDTYGLEFVKSKSTINDSQWNLILPEPFELQAFRNETKAFSVLVPRNASLGFYDLTLRVFSLNDPRQTSVAEYTFHPYVAQFYALSQNLERSSITDRAAETVLYPLEIRNDGNGLDTLEVRVEEQRVPAGWSVRLDDRAGTRTQVDVPAGTTRVVNLTVTSPAGEREGRVAFVNVTATSSGPERTPRELRPSVEFETRTEVLKAPNFQLTPRARQLTGIFIDPNATLAFDVDVRNVGNLWDNITLTTRDTPLGWNVDVANDVLDLAPTGRLIQHPTTGTSTVRVTAPRTADVGEEAVITLVATSEVDPSLSRTIKFGFRVSGPDLAIGGLGVSRSHVYAGDPVNVTVTVMNSGNKAPDTDPVLRVLYSSGGTERIVTERTLADLGGGASRAITIPWDTKGLAGAGTLIARVDPNDVVEEITESNNERLLSGDQTFIRLFDVRLQAATGLTVRAGERVLYEETPNAFVLQNFGNTDEEVTVTTRSENGWFETITSDKRVSPGDEVVLGFTFNVPELPGLAEDTIVVDVVPKHRGQSTLTATARTRLADDAPPAITNVTVTPAAPTVATPVTLSATVLDALGVESVTAYLRTPLNDVTPVTLAKGEDGRTWTAVESLAVAGEYRLYVEAVDQSSSRNVADTRADHVTFEVTPGSAPTIEPVTDLTVPVRSGTPLEFRVRDDALSVARVYYVMGGEEVDVPVNGRVDTTDWAPGRVTFTLVAENTYGVETRREFTVDVDNTPPTLSNVELDPAKPKQGEAVTIRVNVDASVDAVEVVIKRDGEVVDRLDASSRGPGRFEATYTPGAGKFTVDAIAKDAAGNTQTMESSVVFSTTGLLSGVPAPGAVLGVLALLGAAVVTARRRA